MFEHSKWSWSGEKLNRSFYTTSTIDKIWNKIYNLLFSLASFFFITSITSILTQTISLYVDCLMKVSKDSFMELVTNPVVLAHSAKFIITYWMFQASKDSLKSTINENEENLLYYMFSVFIIVDVYRLIFMRSALR